MYRDTPFQVLRLRCRIGFWELLDDLGEVALGVGEPAFGERRMTNAKHQLWEKVVRRQETLDAMTLLARAIKDQDGWRPLRAITSAEPLELGRLFARVDANRDEVVIVCA